MIPTPQQQPLARTILATSLFAVAGLIAAVQCSSDNPPLTTSTMDLLAWEAACPPVDGGLLPESVTPIDAGSVTFTATNIDVVLNWAAGVPVNQKSVLLAQIATAASHSGIVNAYNGRFNLTNFPVTDLGKELVFISIVGQMRKASSVNPLIGLANHNGVIMANCSYNDAGVVGGGNPLDVTPLDCDTIIRSRAVEMAAYIEAVTTSGVNFLTKTKTIITNHSNPWVRRAAIDAYMYFSGDSADAAATMNSIVSPADVLYIGRARFTSDMDATAFDNQVAAFYDAHPSEVPPDYALLDAQPDGPLPNICNTSPNVDF